MTYDSMTGLNFDAKPSGDAAIVEFFMKPVKNNFRSEQEGRAIFDNLEYVRIITPGDKRSVPEERVKDDHRQRWPQQYAAFKQGLEVEVSGTPLEAWPLLSNNPALIAEYKAVNVKTVEALAAVSDALLPQLGMGGRDWRTKALAWLDSARQAAPLAAAEQRIRELEEEKAVYTQKIDALTAAVQKMQEKADA